MDSLPDKELLLYWLSQYGSFAIFGLLALGIIALPVPEESMMVFSGILMSQGELPIYATIIAAYAGSICGITVSYIIGRTAGHYLLLKYGGWLGLTQEKLDKLHKWGEHYGKWTLLFGYFIPGVRHFTGVSAGMTDLAYHQFALFAYTGAVLWVSLFLSIGYFFGDYWLYAYEIIETRIEEIVIGLIILVISYLFIRTVWKRVP